MLRFPKISLQALRISIFLGISLVSCQPKHPMATLENTLAADGSMNNDAFVAEMFTRNEGKPGWPDFPRRWKIYSNNYSGEAGVEIGLKVPLGDSGNTTTIKFSMMRQTKLWVLMHAPELTAQMTKNDNGMVYFNARDEYKMVAICMFSAHLNTSGENLSKLSFAGSGGFGSAKLAQETEMTQTTDFMPIKMGDSMKDWQERCEQIFEDKIKHSVIADLQNVTQGMRYHIAQEQCIIPQTKEERFFEKDGRPGDRSCEKQHNDGLSILARSMTSRCIHQEGMPENLGLCRLRAPAAMNCRLYQDSSGNVSGIATAASKLVSSPAFTYPCDEQEGLSCHVTKKGGWFKTWSEPYSYWEGECRKKEASSPDL